jgi:hypothetical protein
MQALVPHAMPNDNIVSLIQSFFHESPSLPQALFWLFTILLVSLWVAAASVERKEYVLEQ